MLFLGAGATVGAKHRDGLRPPNGAELAKLIAGRFLGKGFDERPLVEVADLAISEADLQKVQEFVAEIFEGFSPAPFHLKIPTLPWAAISTTNYDLIVERAYETVAASDRVQDIVKFLRNSDRVDAQLRSSRAVPFLKLHGCVSQVKDPKLPLILTVDQYITHKSERHLLFNRLEELAHNYPFLFVGHKLADPNLRAVLMRIAELGDSRPRSYLVSPGLSPAELNFWSRKKITCLPMTFEEILAQIDREIPPIARKIAPLASPEVGAVERSLARPPSAELQRFLQRDVDALHSSFATEKPDAKSFYSGYFSDWAPIAHGLDVERKVTLEIQADSVFSEDAESANLHQQLFILKGHAGSGKTVALHRMAWDAGVELGLRVLVLRPTGMLSIQAVQEFLEKSGGRTYLYIDRILDYRNEVEALLRFSRQEKRQLTIVGTAREAQWNQTGSTLDQFVSKSYQLRYLSEREIDDLLAKLEKNDALGSLKPLPPNERRMAMEHRAGRQLLVALHEATLGRPFSDIVFDEYNGIADPLARSLYLTVAILHRLGVTARAGLISRIHGIPFRLFQERLFKPLERIVFAQRDTGAVDYVYVTRHQHVAEILFERALRAPEERRDEYIRLVSMLDTGYDSDRIALKGLTQARQLIQLFSDHGMRRAVMQRARDRFPADGALCQQAAILEMTALEGSLDLASKLLVEAQGLTPHNSSISHSRAELALRRAQHAVNPNERAHWYGESRRLALTLADNGAPTPHAYHTLMKVGLLELEEVLTNGDPPTIERHVRSLEKSLVEGLQRLGPDSYLLDADARLSQLLSNAPRALQALRRAFEQNPGSAYLARRLASQCRHAGNRDEAKAVLKRCLEESPNERDVHLMLGILLLEGGQSGASEARSHLRHSFTEGDARDEARFEYARACFLSGEYEDARKYFFRLRSAAVSYARKTRVSRRVRGSSFTGTVARLWETTGVIRDARSGQDVFFSARSMPEREWQRLVVGCDATYQIAFNFYGPIAIGVRAKG